MREKKKSNVGIIIAVIVAVILLLAIVAGVFIFVLIGGKEKRAEKKLDAGNQYLKNSEYEDAIECFEKVVKLDPENSKAYIGMAEAYAALGEYDVAMDVINEGIDCIENSAENGGKPSSKLKLNRLTDKLNEIETMKNNSGVTNTASGGPGTEPEPPEEEPPVEEPPIVEPPEVEDPPKDEYEAFIRTLQAERNRCYEMGKEYVTPCSIQSGLTVAKPFTMDAFVDAKRIDLDNDGEDELIVIFFDGESVVTFNVFENRGGGNFECTVMYSADDQQKQNIIYNPSHLFRIANIRGKKYIIWENSMFCTCNADGVGHWARIMQYDGRSMSSDFYHGVIGSDLSGYGSEIYQWALILRDMGFGYSAANLNTDMHLSSADGIEDFLYIEARHQGYENGKPGEVAFKLSTTGPY